MREEKPNFDIDDICDEIWESIFLNCLPYKDIINLFLTCKRFSRICVSENIWKNLGSQRWKTTNCGWDGVSSYWLYKRRHVIEKDLKPIIVKIGNENFNADGISKCHVYQLLNLVQSENEVLIVTNSLKYFAKFCKNDLNLKYLSTKLYILLHQYNLEIEWKKMILEFSSDGINDLEKGACFISKWFDYEQDVSIENVTAQLDMISKRISARLPQPLPIVNTTFTEEQLKAILVETNHVLFEELGFKGNTEAYYDVNNSYIDKVINGKKGIPISLSIIYMAVTGRLGLKPQSINFPGHFLIRFNVELKEGNTQYIYVDAFHKGDILSKLQCIAKFGYIGGEHLPDTVLFPVADKTKVFIRQITNIINICLRKRNLAMCQSCLELRLLLAPGDPKNKLDVCDMYLGQGINLDEVEQLLRQMISTGQLTDIDHHKTLGLLQQVEEKKKSINMTKKPKYRSSTENQGVIYRIGMVMKHKRYEYECVIASWDAFCDHSETWKVRMGVYNLKYKDQQPFYLVLANDGSTRYASQENIYPLENVVEIEHGEIGKYFSSFDGKRYIPTESLSEIFPDDQQITC